MKSERVKEAENEVNLCLNYGGVFVDNAPTTDELELAYEFSDIKDEIEHMRRFAKALNELASALMQENESS